MSAESESRRKLDAEAVSAWLDGELRDAVASEKLANTPAARRLRAAYEQLDRAAQTATEPEPERLARLIEKCRRPAPAPVLILWPRVLLRAAAALALLACGYLAKSLVDGWNSHSGAVAKAPEATLPAKVYPEGTLVAAPVPAADREAPVAEGVDWADAAMVSGEAAAPRRGAAPPAVTDRIAVRNAPAGVGNHVWHVWLVDDPAKPLDELARRMPQVREELDKLKQEQRDHYLLQVMISDRNLQDLVSRFEEMGFDLLSPAHPQPTGSTKLDGRLVRYEVDFVRY